MILERLEITGFGCLHDLTTELHPRVTVVAGRNESGKSTLLRAVRGALYGVDAGGQGRAVDRSDWARYEPWTRGGYGLALTYKLDDGRRIRVARRLDTREQSVQVLELGGSELTDELRSGRSVTPGRFHLGIDEAVFCATAWLSDDGLRIDAPESARQRAGPAAGGDRASRRHPPRRDRSAGPRAHPRGDGSGRLRAARRAALSASRPHGFGTLDRTLADARTRLAAVAVDQERLAVLDATLATETEHWVAAERARLAGRLSEVADRRVRLAEMVREGKLQAAEVEATASYARFSARRRDRGHHPRRRAGSGKVECRGRGGTLAGCRRAAATDPARREEIAAGIAAIGLAGQLDGEVGERSQRLRGELIAVASAARRTGGDDAREAALRREIAATGLRSLPPQR